MRLSRSSFAALGAVLLAASTGGCRQDGADIAAAPDAGTVAGLPVSYNRVMVALVNDAADPVWRAAWRTPESEADWRELERRAFQLEIAGTLLALPGTGPQDAEWSANPAWQTFATRLRASGETAVAAVQARDTERISLAGDEIVEVCEACHLVFKPDLPTEGLFGELSPTSADFESEAPPGAATETESSTAP